MLELKNVGGSGLPIAIGMHNMLKNTIVGFLIAITTVAILIGGWLAPVDDQIRAFRFDFDNHAPSGKIVLVDIDAKSIKDIGVWPWKRGIYAQLLDRLQKLNVSEVAFDVDFSSASIPAQDKLFSEALARAESTIILAVFNQMETANPQNKTLQSNLPIPLFLESAWPAIVNVFPNAHGYVQSFPLGGVVAGDPVQSMPAILSGHNGSADGAFLIDFGLDADRIERVSVSDILSGNVAREKLAGKKIIVGANAAELRDFFSVPRYGIVSGHLLQAVAAETLLQGRSIKLSGIRVNLIAVFTATFLLVLALQLFSWSTSITICLSAALFLEGGSTWLQVTRAYSLQTAAPLFAMLAFTLFIVLREIDLRKILILISEKKAQNTQTILDRVIDDNFEGVIIILEDDTIYTTSKSARRLLKENNPDIPDNLTGACFSEIAPKPFADAVSVAVSNMKSGTWTLEPPHILDGPYGGADRKILEYGVMPSKLEGSIALDGHHIPDSIVACLSVRDITKRRLADEKIAYLARFDATTGLPNRNHFIEYASLALEARRQDNCCLAIVCVSLDRFRNVQDALGHRYAESILNVAIERAHLLLSPCDFLASLGTSELVVLIESVSNKSDLEDLVERLVEELAQPYYHAGQGAAIGASAGIVIIPDDERFVDTLIKNADAALNRANSQSGNSYSIFEPAMETNIQVRQALELDLWKAIDLNQFRVYYQPQVLLSDGSLCGAEALIRWIHPERGFVSPEDFISIAEQSHLIVDLGEWVLEQACKDVVSSWPAHLKVAVNISPSQFMQGDLVETVKRIIHTTGMSTDQLDLEITESLFIEDNGRIVRIMNELREMGIHFALDDFGTGYSSLGYIQHFPLDKIKIDQSFVKDLGRNPQSLAIVQTISALANNLGMKTVAEGIEEQEHHSLLHLAGCTIGQGYHYGKPMPLEDMLLFIENYEGGNLGLKTSEATEATL